MQSPTPDPVSVTPDEMAAARTWLEAKVRGVTPPPSPRVRIEPPPHSRTGPLSKRHPGGLALRIADQTYARGLYCHAVTRFTVKFPGPAKSFTAVVGVHSNPGTQPEKGNVVFAVEAGGKTLLRSDVMREGMPGVPIHVDLNGASELTLDTGDGGLGHHFCQGVWADARVLLADGSTLWLDESPSLHEGPNEPHDVAWPFSFKYDGKPSREWLAGWSLERKETRLDAARTQYTLTWSDPATKLQVQYIVVTYADFPAVEWTVYLKNTGTTDTPLLEDIQALDATFHRAAPGRHMLHHFNGDHNSATGYEPYHTPLGAGARKTIAPFGGRPCNFAFPYFNLQMPGEGCLLAVGWPGQWSATFACDAETNLHLRAGQELTRLKLRPGEQIRTPLVAMLFWRGEDLMRAGNLWRRWMIRHNLPRIGGEPPKPILAATSHVWTEEMSIATTPDQLEFVESYIREKIPLDVWWMDAGWYPHDGKSWPNTGTWELDADRFPRGLRPITDRARTAGIKSMLWFEPERVAPGTWLHENHPEWLLNTRPRDMTGIGATERLDGTYEGQSRLLNIGDPRALNWLVEHISALIHREGIDLYRQDYNLNPLPYWRDNDAADRQGATENHYVRGYLAYWDALRQRFPDMLIDSCASGGRRNDLETLRRSVPLHKTDYKYGDHTVKHAFNHSLFQWIPFFGTLLYPPDGVDAYAFRSSHAPLTCLCYDARRKNLDFAAIRKLCDEWRRIAPYYYGDYYPLTPYTRQPTDWIGWQFHRPEQGDGMIQVYRRSQSPYESARFPLHGIDPRSRYRVEILSENRTTETTGKDLSDRGLLVELSQVPHAAVILYVTAR